METEKQIKTGGVLLTVAGNLWFGLLTFYWKTLKSVSAVDMLAVRIATSFIINIIYLAALKKMGILRDQLKNKKSLVWLLALGPLLFVSWYTTIWGTMNGYVIELSIGMFVGPLFVSMAGAVIFKEKVDRYTIFAFALALFSIIYMTVSYGKPPVISLIMAVCCLIYYSVKKKANADAYVGMLLESVVDVPFAIAYLIYTFSAGTLTLSSQSGGIITLALLAGFFNVTPQLILMIAQKKISMITLGLLTYIMPLTQTLIGVLVYKEEMTATHAVAIISVSIGIAIYTFGQKKRLSASEKAGNAISEENRESLAER